MMDPVVVRWGTALASAIACSGCATAQYPPHVNAQSAYVVQRVTRPEGACRAAADSVLAAQLTPQAPMLRPDMPPTPPTPPTAELGHTAMVTLYVDARGRVSKDSVEVKGVTDAGYIAALRAMAAKLQFFPAVANGCAVPDLVVLPFAYHR